MTRSAALITLQNTQLTLEHKLCLDDISLAIPSQGITIIAGANGSGKTVLLRLCAGLLTPSKGDITYDVCLAKSNSSPSNDKNDKDHKCNKPAYPAVTWVPQTPVLLDRTVAQNIALPLLQASRTSAASNSASTDTSTETSSTDNTSDISALTQQALAWANIASLANTLTSTLSTGQQQLVALARAWAVKPRLLLLDEPCANLDPKRHQQVDELIQQMSDEGCKIVMSSHHLSQIKRLADDIVFLDAGKLVTHRSCESFFNASVINDGVINGDKVEHEKANAFIQEKIHTFIQYA